MITDTASNPQHRNIQIYFLAAPEDEAVCEDIIKHLKPKILSSSIPIEVNSDFNIPAGMEKEQHMRRLLEADIVLALISVDFIDNDDIYERNQKVIERYNNRQTIMIPILVRNFMWRDTPFVSLPVLPKNLQPLNNKLIWPSPDDAVMAVVGDIYDSINRLAQRQRTILEPFTAEPAERTPEVQEVSGPAMSQPASSAVESAAAPEAVPEPAMSQPEPAIAMTQLPAMQDADAQPSPAANVESPSEDQAVPDESMGQITSMPGLSVPIAADWRKKYYRRVLLKRAGAILLDQIIIVLIPLILLVMIFPGIDDTLLSIIMYGIYFLVMPWMESSKRQATIGKRILKLEITDRDGDRITFLRALWRNIMRTAVLYLYFVTFGILLIVQYWRFTKTRKLFQDELSGTVIGERLASSSTAIATANATT